MPKRTLSDVPPPRPKVLTFLQAIKENPDDDTTRLILADWLEERGDPRGEFIRIQCQLARLGEADPTGAVLGDPDERARIRARIDQADPIRGPLVRRERELLEQHATAWLGPLGKLVKKWEFRRGLVRVDLTAQQFLSAALVKLTATEAYAWVDSLHLRGVTSEALAPLVSAPHLAHFTTLDLDGNDLRAAGAQALAASPQLAHLTTLNLACNGIRDKGTKALAASPHLARLTTLDLCANGIGAEGVQALAASPHLARLTTLNLRANGICDAGAQTLAAAPHLARLTTLNLYVNGIGDAGAQALAAAFHLAHLAMLHLESNPIGAAGAEALRARFGKRVQV
jgi:uncharacterized protein (TIGR02996 family)